MAKIYGLFGAMSGKVADVVMSVRNGQQIVRKYQPVVANPKTQNQFSTRARFKLISQLSAVFAPYIAIRKIGGVSARNIFTSKNFPFSSFDLSSLTASVELESLQLTDSVVYMPPVSAQRAGDTNDINLSLTESLIDVSRVVYMVFAKTGDQKLRAVLSIVQDVAGVNHRYVTSVSAVSDECVVYAYAIRDNTETASIAFGNLTVVTAETIAKLIISRNLTERDVTVSETVGATVAARSSSKSDDEDEKQAAKKK